MYCKDIINNKKVFFELYNKIKKGDINISSIEYENLQKICKMLEEEYKLKAEKIRMIKKDIKLYKKRILRYRNIDIS